MLDINVVTHVTTACLGDIRLNESGIGYIVNLDSDSMANLKIQQ